MKEIDLVIDTEEIAEFFTKSLQDGATYRVRMSCLKSLILPLII